MNSIAARLALRNVSLFTIRALSTGPKAQHALLKDGDPIFTNLINYDWRTRGVEDRKFMSGTGKSYTGIPKIIKRTVTTSQRVLSKQETSEENINKKGPATYDPSNEVHRKIHKLITESKKRVFVFMKGVPSEPLCGYSTIVVRILGIYDVDYDSFNVLADEEVRQQIKVYSDWPTIPQVYIDGSFVGGCDILLQMEQSGELAQLLGDKK